MKKSLTEMTFMLLLLLLFVFCSFFTMTYCADFYQQLTLSQQQQNAVQVPYLYLFTRLHGQTPDNVEIRTVQDSECLVIREQVDQRRFETLIYAREGSLYELLMEEGRPVDLAYGERISAVQELHFELEQAMLQVHIGSDTLSIALKEAEG